MRIHSNILTSTDLDEAARIARVTFTDSSQHGSRTHARAFNVLLTGESRRRPNSGSRGAGDEYAATWDQWGVFLGVLFDRDPNMVTPYYRNADDFHSQTCGRFDRGGEWPTDAHGDHTFKYTGTPYENACTKCSAVRRWQAASRSTLV